jgi:hypothetical protein
MRTSLHLSCVQDFDALKLVGSVTHKTNGVAVEGILQTGLRNGFDNKGRYVRRVRHLGKFRLSQEYFSPRLIW